MNTLDKELIRLFETDLQPLRRKLDHTGLSALIADFTRWNSAAGKKHDEPLLLRIVEFLTHTIEEERGHIHSLHTCFTEFNKRWTGAISREEKQEHILDFARALGADSRQLKGDKRAFSRWFGADAVIDRYQKQVSAVERKIVLSLERLSVMAALILQSKGHNEDHAQLWRRLKIESVLKPLLNYTGDSRVRIEAFRCLARVLKVMPEESHNQYVEESILQYVFRAALDRNQDMWMQCEALQLLESLSLDTLEVALNKRLTGSSHQDDFFVRSRAVTILGDNLQRIPALGQLLPRIANDPSPYVRQTLVHILPAAADEDLRHWLCELGLHDPVVQVRAGALLQIVSLLTRPELFEFLLNLLCRVLEKERETFVLRVALKVCVDGLFRLIQTDQDADAVTWYTNLIPGIEKLHQEAEHLSVRRWAAQSREKMWCELDPRTQELKQQLLQRIHHLKPGRKKRLPRSFLSAYDEHTLGRVLAVISQEDFGYSVKQHLLGGTVRRGHHFVFRFWRFLYELFHPSPDKRQAFPHTIGRTFSGTIHCPSGILSELAPTKVPGEPLYMAEEAGWRPYLPLVDEILSALDGGFFQRNVTQIYTPEGITEIQPPGSFIKRWWAKASLTLRYAYYARLRNWQASDQISPASYTRAFARLGVQIRFNPYASEHTNAAADPAVSRFFCAAIPFVIGSVGSGNLAALGNLLTSDSWLRVKEYFFSVYQNSLSDLGLFAAVLAVIFLGRSVYLKYLIRRARQRLPLVIGGWGTRGKSSVERMKAALFNALGYGVLSKTTGCEAMFLHAHPYDTLREMFLFRPYDKATIWEQHNLTRLADHLQVDVFLWECMGLTPSYVRVLQREWMRDDLSTLTNTYPDHEDVQGPAGINIPEVMTDFIPESSLLVTTEEQMLPILTHASKTIETRAKSVTWLEAGLITSDVLERFSYKEHPYNIALVLAMAEELGIDKDFALKEIADHVVPDIGVLKVYPPAPFRSRRLEFVSGNSANERLAALENWKRTGFDTHDLDTDPGIWIVTVVNNRADRIPRSRVFARILAEDISADRHVLIGSNLSGLSGYIKEAWQEYAQQLTLWPKDDDQNTPQKVLAAQARHLRVPINEEQVKARLRAMLQGQQADWDSEEVLELWHAPEDLQARLHQMGIEEGMAASIAGFLKQDIANFEEYQAFSQQLAHPAPDQKTRLDNEFRRLAEKWFHNKIIIIWDYHATGNQIIQRICEETPPGLYARIMGLQNIKGTGLDFVYSWQRWERCFTACNQLRSDDPSEVEHGLRTLSGFQEYNLLCEEYTRNTVHEARGLPIAQNERFQAELAMILSNLDNAMNRIAARPRNTGRTTAWPVKILEIIEAFRDAGDAIKRRRMANRIYKDLVNGRISHERAALELQTLEKRQKGGWLTAQFQALLQRYAAGT